MESRKGAPDCPICLESLDPPKRIFQCSEGHFLCETCRRNPAIKWCPTCRGSIVGRNIGMEQVLQEFCGVSDNLPQNPRPCISLPEDGHVMQMRRPPVVQRAQLMRRPGSSHLEPLRQQRGRGSHLEPLSIESQLLKIHMGRGWWCNQRMARRPGEMIEVRASHASEDGASSTTSYSDNDAEANRLLTMARGRGLQILQGMKKPGGLMDKENKE